MQSGSVSNSEFINNTAMAGQGGGLYLETTVVDVINSRCAAKQLAAAVSVHAAALGTAPLL